MTTTTETTHALYRFFDSDGVLLYVGITADPGTRFATHQAEKPWWSEAIVATLEQYPTRAAALAAEHKAILAELPRHNWPSRNTAAGELAGAAELAQALGVSRQRVYQLTSRPDFPEPIVRLKAGAVWTDCGRG